MKKKFTKLIAVIALLTFLIPLTGWGQTRDTKSYTLTISASDFNTTSYAANNNEKTTNAIASDNSTYEVSWTSNQVMKNGDNMQWQKNKGYIYNSTDLGTITSVTVNSSAGSFTTYYGTSEHPTSGTTVGNGFFTTMVGGATGTTSSVVIEFTIETGGGSSTYNVTYKPGTGATGTNVVDSDISGAYTVRANDGQNGNPDFSKTGHNFSCWNDGTDDVNAGDEITVSSNVTLTAQWIANTYTVTLPTTDTYGEYTMDATNPVAYGTTVNLTYTPASGYDGYTATWTVNGEPISGSSFTMPDEAVTVGVSVAAYVQPTGIEIVPNYTFWGKDSQFSGNTYDNLSGSKDNVSLAWSRGSGSTYANTTAMRFYKDNTLVFTAPTGYEIKSIELTGSLQSDMEFSPTGFNSEFQTWTGSSATVTMSRPSSGSSYASISKFTITLGAPSSVATPTFDPVEGTYSSSQNVTISTTTDGATIYYTTDGTDPTTSSTEYTAAIPVNSTTTIKAIAVLGSDVSSVASATYTILPIEHAGTQADPYTVADARNAIDVNTTVSDAYVTGIISQVDSYNSTYHSITYWISDDGTTTTDQLQVYSGKGLNGADFSSVGDVVVGATVMVKGNLKKYNSTYEFDVNSELVEYTAPVTPSVTPSSFLIDAAANTGVSGTLTVTYANITTVAADVWFCNAAGTEDATYSWIVANVNADNNVEYLIEENTGAARTAYFKVWAYDDGMNEVYSDLVTVTQAAPVVDYATLPFIWAGGTKSELEALDGVTTNGLGTDYAAANAPYRVKMDGANDYIQVKTDVQPVKVTIDVKMIGGATTSKLKVQESANGSDFTDVQVFEISGSQNTIFNFETTESFAAATRYVKIIKSVHGSNIGVGPITIYTTTTIPVNATTHEIESDVTVAAGYLATITSETIIPSGKTLTVNGILANTTAANLVIKEGGQLVHDNTGVSATLQKHINGYTGEKDNYYLISSPFDVEPADVTNMLNGNYDLYEFDYWEDQEWQNYEQGQWTTMWSMQGYLYANSVDTDLEFAGELAPSSDNTSEYYSYYTSTGTEDFNGWALAGNPFACNAYPVLADGTAASFYKISGSEVVLSSETFMRPLEGIFIKFTDENTYYYFNRTAPVTSPALNLTVSEQSTTREAGVFDRARIRFDQGANLDKFQLNPQNTKLYIPQNGKDFAVVRSEGQGEMPVNFKAAKNGTYTLSIEAENVEMDYLHLIDNLTGADVDLLQTPSYTFTSKTTDYASRFRLVFNANSVNDETENETFAFINGEEIIITNAEANATLQVVDMMGRILVSTKGANRLSTAGMTQGVYVIRLVNGEKVKTQKIVVR